jgi:hypothetical protein
MIQWKAVGGIALAVAVMALTGPPVPCSAGEAASPAQAAALSDSLDTLLAPIALYPDQLLAPMLLSAANPARVIELSNWLKQNTALKGTDLQEAAQTAGFEASLVALVPFPQVVDLMAADPAWTAQVGQTFATNRTAAAESIQRLRAQSQALGNLKSTPQQTVETRTTTNGQEVIVIEPANPQVVYVPQYNPQVVYTQPPPTTVVVEDDDAGEAAAAGLIGFTAGIVLGAAVNDDCCYGRYGWNDWDDIYDEREDLWEDRQDYADERRDDARENQSARQDQRQGSQSERQSQRQSNQSQRQSTAQTNRQSTAQANQANRQASGASAETAQANRANRQSTAQSNQASRQSAAQQARSSGAAPQRSSTASTQSRGYSSGGRSASGRSGTRSDAFSGFSSGSSTRKASSRGQRSRSSSGGGRRGGGRR